MKILVTGSNGFIAKNLIIELTKNKSFEIFKYKKNDSLKFLKYLILKVDFIIHLAGVNRTNDDKDFYINNSDLSSIICKIILDNYKETNKHIPVIFSSSSQAILNNNYGISKLKAENHFIKLNKEISNPIYILRLPNVFGKWCKPNYNSVVATFCSNIASEKEIIINDPHHNLTLVYIDDLIYKIIDLIKQPFSIDNLYVEIEPKFNITVGEIANKIKSFKDSRNNLIIDEVGKGLDRCLYATFLSYFNPDQFYYYLKDNTDRRGSFVEFLKTKNSGQFSFFTAHPGETRGGHYHNTKNEKFLVIQGIAKFRFFNVISEEKNELIVKSSQRKVVETIPGWAHDIKNIGNNDLIVMLWANEVFDSSKPDTYHFEFL